MPPLRTVLILPSCHESYQHTWDIHHNGRLVCARCYLVPEDQKALRKQLGITNLNKSRTKLKAEARKVWAEQALDGPYTEREYRLMAYYGNVCCYCKKPFSKIKRPTLEHKVPRTRGGVELTIEGNLDVACKQCNNEKGPLTPREYDAYLLLRENGIKRSEALRLVCPSIFPSLERQRDARVTATKS
jgi:5-methylcytosine-specific restriction endonuclease McrA